VAQDLAYIEDLMNLIEENEIAAPAPIEQRWTASSAAPMSPAHSNVPTDIHSWVGIIMYMPTDVEETRQQITEAFERYSGLCEEKLMPAYGAKWHWAKLETEFKWKRKDDEFVRLEWVRQYLRDHYDVSRFNHVRRTLDPQNNLGNQWLNDVLPLLR
jgi:L-galactono-1,4-lactone dehydrogenase